MVVLGESAVSHERGNLEYLPGTTFGSSMTPRPLTGWHRGFPFAPRMDESDVCLGGMP